LIDLDVAIHDELVSVLVAHRDCGLVTIQVVFLALHGLWTPLVEVSHNQDVSVPGCSILYLQLHLALKSLYSLV
jgi:hypothetical protein